MRIRECVAADAAAIDTMFREFVAHLRSIGDRSHYRFGAEQYLVDGFGADPVFRGFIVEADSGGPCGYVLFSRRYDGDYTRSLYIVDLYVRPGFRGHGVGRQLMGAVEDVARRAGITRLAWDVHPENADAIRFYKSTGAFTGTDALPMYLDLTGTHR